MICIPQQFVIAATRSMASRWKLFVICEERRRRFSSSDLPTGAQIALPEWMLTPELCDRLSYEDTPRVELPALLDLHRLIDAQRVDHASSGQLCGESASGGQDAEQQRKSHRDAAQAALRGRGDLDRASGIDAGTLPRPVAPAAGKRAQGRREEA